MFILSGLTSSTSFVISSKLGASSSLALSLESKAEKRCLEVSTS